ncbi:DNA polymerase III subunit gamma/tau [Bombella sp. TMW 2.2543]|uniref:DNA polymerase III subunit gamma/tau n=1 Tax=Bombella pluederhausensis TaxID=2967336 RepID=A0ABT3WFV7_9PROT|nr:DNA polymerase III subunit gamma/tau [Bombella pluederhausensis]MCX5617961.1 DNA polymerase III subunit gamma/tau [Bombella pluederhausensis]
MSEEDIPLPPEGNAGFFAETPAAEPEPAQSGTPYRVLARKYRPQTFNDLIGQESLVRILRRAFAVGRVAHAFMLTGVRGVGKTTTARIIARALNCTGQDGKGGPTADPCGVCPNCKAILADRHPDVLEMDAASRTGVDDVREIIEASRFRPMQARMKVFVIDEVHMLSRNAFNALLKTLEEPPAQVTFIFATTELRKVPVTVLSRCQRFDLQRVPQTMLAEHFARIAGKEGAELEEGALALIARAADGSVRDGLSLLDQAIAQGASDTASVADMLGLADRGMVFDLLEAALHGQVASVLEIAGRAYARGADLGVLLTDLMDVLHLLSRIKALPELRDGPELPEMERVRGGAIVDHVGVTVLGRAWQLLLKGLAEVDAAPDRRQAAEMVLIRLCHASMLPTPDKLIRQLQDAPAGSVQMGAAPASQGQGASSSGHQAGAGPASGTAPVSRSVPAQNGGQGMAPSASVRGAEAVMGGSTLQQGSTVLKAAPEQPAPQPLRLATENGAPVPQQKEESASAGEAIPPMPRSWREMVALVGQQKEARLHGMLRHLGHPVEFAPPRLVLRLAEADSEQKRQAFRALTGLLDRLYPGYWQVIASDEQGEPTLDEQGAEIIALHQDKAKQHPLVQAIMRRFPQAQIGEVRDHSLDDYGLPPEEPTVSLGEDVPPDFEFAPPDADYSDEDDFY